MKMGKLLLAGLVAGLSSIAINAAQAVEIEYWQYVFESRVKTMDKLIENFEKANPDIKVKQVTFPYDDYQTRVIAAKMAGKSPEVMQLFYGWLDKFAAGGILQPLPQDAFPHDKIESEFFPIVSAMKRGDEYYGLPTAVRSLALFYNKKLFEEAGLDPNNPPKNLDELLAYAQKATKRDASGNLLSEGITLDMPGQDLHWWREVLVRQFGGKPYSDDYRKVAYDDAAGEKALQFYTDLQTKYKVGEVKFMDEGHAAFRSGKAAMTVDGTFRLAAFNTIKDFEWGVTELPANAEGVRSNYASYFANGISASAKGEKLEAAAKFLNYITSPEAMEIWLKGVGELPARSSAALTQANLADPVYGPFLKGLEYAHTTMFTDELKQRQIVVDMSNRVILQNQPVKESLDEAAKAEQAILDTAK